MIILWHARDVRAADFTVRSKTLGESYRIRGRDGLFSFTKTRLIQSLSLYGGHIFKPLLKGKQVPLKLTLNVNLMLGHDFGVKSYEMDPDSLSGYVPLLRKTSFGFLRGYIHLSYGKFKRTDVRIGRQTAYDVTGMYAFDGIKTGFTWFGIASADFSYGFETIPMFNLAVMDFSPQGTSWGNRNGLLEDVHPEITQPELRPMLAATTKLLVSRSGLLSLGYRRTYTDLDMNRVSFERLSFGFSMSNTESPLNANVIASYDFLWERISEVIARTNIQLASRWSLIFNFMHFYPVFDSSSIFNVFFFDPFNELSMGFSFEPDENFNLMISALARQSERDYLEKGGAGVVSDGGGSLHLMFRGGPLVLLASARITDGQSGTIAGMEINPQFHFLNEILILRLGGGLWFFNDPLRRGHHSISGGGGTALMWNITRGIQVSGSVNVFNNRISGFGASTLWMLNIAL